MKSNQLTDHNYIILQILYAIVAASLEDDDPLDVAALGDEPLEQVLLVAETATEYVLAYQAAPGDSRGRRMKGVEASQSHYRNRVGEDDGQAIAQALRVGEAYIRRNQHSDRGEP